MSEWIWLVIALAVALIIAFFMPKHKTVRFVEELTCQVKKNIVFKKVTWSA